MSKNNYAQFSPSLTLSPEGRGNVIEMIFKSGGRNDNAKIKTIFANDRRVRVDR
jgi:hypothetical protein